MPRIQCNKYKQPSKHSSKAASVYTRTCSSVNPNSMTRLTGTESVAALDDTCETAIYNLCLVIESSILSEIDMPMPNEALLQIQRFASDSVH